jgi:hypothetical protein
MLVKWQSPITQVPEWLQVSFVPQSLGRAQPFVGLDEAATQSPVRSSQAYPFAQSQSL